MYLFSLLFCHYHFHNIFFSFWISATLCAPHIRNRTTNIYIFFSPHTLNMTYIHLKPKAKQISGVRELCYTQLYYVHFVHSLFWGICKKTNANMDKKKCKGCLRNCQPKKRHTFRKRWLVCPRLTQFIYKNRPWLSIALKPLFFFS